MRIRDSGMPEEAYWESLLDVELTLVRLDINSTLHNVAELGCGYGTFSVPVARAISGTLFTFDIDPAMVERTRERAQGLRVKCELRDVMAEGFGLRGLDAALLFNILHCEQPVRLLHHAAEAVRPGRLVVVTHWRYAETPRGPDLGIRPRSEQIVRWAEETNRLAAFGDVIDLPPWHFGMRLQRAT